MAVSKVILNGETLMDVTVDTVTSEKLLSGYQATGRDGVKVQGAYVPQSVELAAGSADPSENAQHITPPSGYDGFSYFDVGAIDSDYVGSNIAQNSSADLVASGSEITAPSGYYASAATKYIGPGSATTPATVITTDPSISVSAAGLITAVASSSKSITPTVSAGYISSGTAGTVTASGSNTLQLSTQTAATITPTKSEQTAVASGKYTTGVIKVAAIPSQYIVPSGSTTFTSNSSYDVTEFAEVVVDVPSDMPETQSKTVDPSESAQTVYPDQDKLLSSVVVTAVSSNYVGSNIAQNSAADLSASGSIVTVPSGYYSSEVSKAVSAGSVTIADTSIGLGRNKGLSLTVREDGYVSAAVSSAQEISPTITSGYVSNGTSGIITITGSIGAQIQTQGSKTVTPTESIQTAVSSGVYTTGIVKVDAIPSDYIGSAIASVSVVEGTTTVSGTTAMRGEATWSAGIISSGSIPAATFANSSSAQTQYVDISATTEAPVLVSGGYLYINKGYTDDLKISLAKLVPDGASADLASGVILSGYAAYDNDGNLVAGNIPTKSSTNVSASGSTVTVPSGYYATQVTKDIDAGSVTIADQSLTLNPIWQVSDSGLIKLQLSTGRWVSPAVTSGYVAAVPSFSVEASLNTSYQLDTQAAATITPTESTQTAVASGVFTTGIVTVAAISSDYIGSNVPTKTSANLTASGSIVTAPSGYYAASATKAISGGTATTPSTTITANPEISVNSSTGVITAIAASSKSITPTISAGYIDTGTAGTVTVSGTTSSALSIQAAATINPTESEQTAVAAGKFTTGVVKVGAISSTYVGSGIATKSAADLSASGSVVTVPSGYYASQATKAIAPGSATILPTLISTGNVVFNISSGGKITATATSSKSITPLVTAGYLSSEAGASGVISVNITGQQQMTTQASATITPTESEQTAVAAGKYTTGAVKVGAISSNYVGSNIAICSAADLTTSGSKVTVPSGYYAATATKVISGGSATTPATTIIANPGITVSATGLITATNNKTQNVTPTITAGYISAGTSGTITVNGSNTSQLNTLAATTYTPSTSTQTITSGWYLIGAQTIQGDINLIANNIIEGISIFGVMGTYHPVDDIVIIGDYGACFSNFDITNNTCISSAGIVSGNTLIAI